MISLTKYASAIVSALNFCGGSECIKNTVKLYLESYGTNYDFVQFYVQTDDEKSNQTSVILRYNQTVYCSVGESADFSELSAFLLGFSDCEVYCDIALQRNLDDFPRGETCAIMSKKGECCKSGLSVQPCENAKKISALVTADLAEEKQTDFFLNTSHMLRHGTINVFSYMIDGEPVCAVSVSCSLSDAEVIPFVYTNEHFRGNGYCRKVLAEVCSDESKKYQLLCEEHNIKFYEKCGFSQIDTCVRYRL